MDRAGNEQSVKGIFFYKTVGYSHATEYVPTTIWLWN
jgi:hypothetical protein